MTKCLGENGTVSVYSEQELNSNEMRMFLRSTDIAPVRLYEAEVYTAEISALGFSENAMVYADNYQMFDQTYSKLRDISEHTPSTDKDHYKLPQTAGFFTAYNYIYIEETGRCLLLGATSCERFVTEIRLNQKEIRVIQMLEGKEIPAGSDVSIESFCVIEAADRNLCLSEFAEYICKHHPTLPFREIPDGWCSWYCHGPSVTEDDIQKNLKVAKQSYPQLKYIQIDDGYQPHMGDWLLQTDKFKQKMKDLCLEIRAKGFEPAMWVAPFIASEQSQLFKEHPDWFIKNDKGRPLSAADCTFQGWRDAPWYFLDPTHPEANAYIKEVFRIMKYEWGVDYFKLDANVWGALPFGVRYDNSLTSVEAYRHGMNSIWEAVDNDYENTFMLGCNAPMWPSLGVVNGMRVTTDVARNKHFIHLVARQCAYRNWMHKKLWINDPDCLLQIAPSAEKFSSISPLRKALRKLNEKLYRYEAASIRASGGMVLSGDKLFSLNEYDVDVLKKLLGSERSAAQFNDDYSLGVIRGTGETDYLLFNRTGKTKAFELPLDGTVTDLFKDREFVCDGTLRCKLRANDAAWFRTKNN